MAITKEDVLNVFALRTSVSTDDKVVEGEVKTSDKFLLQTANGSAVRVSAEIVRAYLAKTLGIGVNSEGYITIGGKVTNVKVNVGGVSEADIVNVLNTVLPDYDFITSSSLDGYLKEDDLDDINSALSVLNRHVEELRELFREDDDDIISGTEIPLGKIIDGIDSISVTNAIEEIKLRVDDVRKSIILTESQWEEIESNEVLLREFCERYDDWFLDVVEDDENAIWTFGSKFPIKFSTRWTFGSKFPIKF